MAAPHLIGDIGGTNARFALAGDNGFFGFAGLRVADYPDIAAALRVYLATRPESAAIRGATLAVAGPVEHNRCRLTNSPWEIGPDNVAGAVQGPVILLNDLEAVAWSLPLLEAGDCLLLHAGTADVERPLLVVAPGTGLGVAALVRAPGDRFAAVASEGGHVSLAPENAEEDALLRYLRSVHGHVSAERALSGAGLEAIHDFLVKQAGETGPFRHAADITAAALAGSCPRCIAAVRLFCALLGSFAGNMALAFGARGGVYIGGGIMPRIETLLLQSAFAERFAAKGRNRGYLESIPIHLICRPDAALLGLVAHSRRWPDRDRA